MSKLITTNDLQDILNEVLPPTPSEYRKLLWTNPNPTANFSAQTVSIDLSDYDEVEVVTVVSRTSGKMGICHLYFTSPVSQSLVFLGDDATKHARDLSINTSGITFQNGYYQYMTSGQSKTTDSGQAIPYKIYGIKYERVSPPQEEIADYIVEQGESNGWTYRKWNSGKAECWYFDYTKASVSFSAWGGLYYADVATALSYPFTFENAPYNFITPYDSQAGVFGCWGTSTTGVGTVRVIHNTNNATTVRFHIYTVGTWK